MKRFLFAGLLFTCMLLAGVSSQAQMTPNFASDQLVTILPPSIASQIDCCVLPFAKFAVSTRTHVNWFNQSGVDVKLTIGKGTMCKEVRADSQMPEEIRSTSCYVIKNLPHGGLRPVMFTDGGLYTYTIEFMGTDRKPETGSVTVF